MIAPGSRNTPDGRVSVKGLFLAALWIWLVSVAALVSAVTFWEMYHVIKGL
jgi:hypothetical protein